MPYPVSAARGQSSNTREWTPALPTTIGVASPYQWLKADAVTGISAGGAVATWSDSGAGNRAATQVTGAQQPTWETNVRAGLPVLRFADIDDCVATPINNAATSHTFFVALLGDAGQGNYIMDINSPRTILAMRDNAGPSDSASYYDGSWHRIAIASDGWQILRFRLNAGNSTGEIWLNGYLLGSSSYSSRALGTGPVLGANSTKSSLGMQTDLAEWLYYASSLSDIDCAQIEQYLATKYRLSVAGVANSGGGLSPTAQNGAWSWFTNPRALRYNGTRDQTYFGTIDGTACVVYAFNHNTNRLESFVMKSNLGQDDHGDPSFLVRNSDKRIMVWYSAHNGTSIYQRISAAPEDVAAWRPELLLDASLGNDEYTYPCPIQLTGEANTPIYLFYRAYPATYYTKSIDDGATWAAGVQIFANGANRPYFHVINNGSSRIDFVVSDGHPNEVATNSLYHCYYTGGNLYKTDGTLIGAIGSGPYTPSASLTKIYDGATHPGWNWDIAIDGSGYPIIAYANFVTTTDHRYRYARWTGSAWTDGEIVAAGGPLYVSETYYSGGIGLDHANPNVVYVSKQVSGQWEIWKYTTANAGVSWDAGVAITSGSSAKNMRPFVPQGASSALRVMWCNGTYTLFTDYSMTIHSDPAYY